jgi:hypothetical protein
MVVIAFETLSCMMYITTPLQALASATDRQTLGFVKLSTKSLASGRHSSFASPLKRCNFNYGCPSANARCLQPG